MLRRQFSIYIVCLKVLSDQVKIRIKYSFSFLTVYFYLRILCKSDIRIISNGEIIGINKFRVRKTTLSSTLLIKLTLSLLGYLKTRICWGGQFDPPSKSHVLCPNMTNDTSLESSCALLLESANQFANLQKLNFLFAIFFAQLVQFVSFSKKLNFIKIWQVKVGQNKDLVTGKSSHSGSVPEDSGSYY